VPEPWTIVGCGYVGERLAARLIAAGHPVLATTRREERASLLRRLGAEVFVGPPESTPSREGILCDSVPGDGGHLSALVGATRARRVIYLSATSVYGQQGDGAWIDEDSPTRGDTARGRARLAAESSLHAAADRAGIESVSLRIAGIYGPGRGVAARLRAGTYRVIGDGSTWSNRIHVDDLVTVILAVAQVQPLPRRTYVVSDGHPTTQREHADAVAAALGLEPPPSVPVEQVSAEAAEMALGNRRILTTNMQKELRLTLGPRKPDDSE
jgi:nucleoside-diphosphate-sugar epimerase